MKNFTLTKEEHIKFILDNFDFGRVHKIMKYLKWEWAGRGVPNILELRNIAERLLNEVYDDNGKWIATGGFKASKYHDFLELEFIVTDWSTEILNNGDHYDKMKELKDKKKKLKVRKKKLQKLDVYENN
jgi:hypothetical protein